MHAQAFAPAPVVKTDIVPAGFLLRALAYLIDFGLLFGLDFGIYSAVHVLAADNVDALTNVWPVCTTIGWFYFVLMESSPAQGTLGKVALGLVVTDDRGDPISLWRAALRNGLKVFSTMTCFFGWAMAAFTPRKQALHDVLARTLVLRKVHYIVIGPEAPTDPGEHWDGGRWVASIPPQERS